MNLFVLVHANETNVLKGYLVMFVIVCFFHPFKIIDYFLKYFFSKAMESSASEILNLAHLKFQESIEEKIESK